MQAELQRRFDLFGSRVALLLGAPPASDKDVRLAALEAEATLRRLHQQLSRFEADSELCQLNRDPRETVEISPAIAALVEAAVRAGELTDGLVDATQLRAIERSGYATTRVGIRPADLEQALAAAPARRRARPAENPAWRQLRVDRGTMTVTRAPGIQLDSGGIGKGLAADLLAARLEGYSSYAVDCGGDLRIGGSSGQPRRVGVDHPLRPGEPAAEFELARGAIATSGLNKRIWRTDGRYAHHLLDPSSGNPAWTGVVQATAMAPTGVEAEARAKAALLSGPRGAHEWLHDFGGIIVLDDGSVSEVEPTRVPVVVGSQGRVAACSR